MIKKRIREILFKIKKINNCLFCRLNKKKLNRKIAIVSCNKWKNIVKEDVLLKIELNKKYIDVDIISWQDKTIDYSNYEALLIRSIWGYQDYIEEFISWLNILKKKNIKVFNNVDILLSNLNKYEQFKILDENNLPHIDTFFINEENIYKINDIYNKYKDIVVKPIISGSGNNTFVVSNTINKNNIKIEDINKKFDKVLNKVNNHIMVQPFIKEIDNGELSVVVINKQISHAVIRYTNIFNNLNQIRVINVNELDKKVLDIVQRCLKIKEYKEALYTRIDLIKIENEYKIMELELVEPQLFLNFRQTKKQLKEFANEIKNRL